MVVVVVVEGVSPFWGEMAASVDRPVAVEVAGRVCAGAVGGSVVVMFCSGCIFGPAVVVEEVLEVQVPIE